MKLVITMALVGLLVGLAGGTWWGTRAVPTAASTEEVATDVSAMAEPPERLEPETEPPANAESVGEAPSSSLAGLAPEAAAALVRHLPDADALILLRNIELPAVARILEQLPDSQATRLTRRLLLEPR